MKPEKASRSKGNAEANVLIKAVARSFSASEVNEYLNKYARSWAMDYFGSDVQVELTVCGAALCINLDLYR